MKNKYSFIILIVFIASSYYYRCNAQVDGEITHSEVVLDSMTMAKDTTNKFKPKFNVYPYAFYSPETALAFGAGGIYVFYTAKDSIIYPSKFGFGGYYSTLKNYKLSVNPALYFFKNNLFMRAPVSLGFFTDKFWGQGDDTPDIGNETYTRKDFSATLYIQSPPMVFAADRSGFVLDYNYTEIVDRKENEILQDSTLIGVEGGALLGIGADLTWESRDNIFFPNSGGYQYFRFLYYPTLSSGYKYIDFELDVRKYWAIKEDHVFATNFYLHSVIGDVPFYRLPALGGSKRMRGYFHGRYRDNFYAMLQVEYRQYFWRRWGFVAFGGIGNVASEIIKYDFGTLKYNFGAGLRFQFNQEQKINLRADFGFGPDGNMGVYFGIEEAF